MGTRQVIATATPEVSMWSLAKSYKVTSEVIGFVVLGIQSLCFNRLVPFKSHSHGGKWNS